MRHWVALTESYRYLLEQDLLCNINSGNKTEKFNCKIKVLFVSGKKTFLMFGIGVCIRFSF